ncbi:uncharacterized protein DUF4834 [Winogradskyella wandonensis]|uniref:Uncharacterized protein DUF4834 n=1 Tax=Winogradskyella wandonensis TaxID=1442586 RepID=A0A4R1KVZ3_9FLAO|nr:DUF4834 family protein [Winogradskyella wandonensis]TCK69376.1 uncharacterized protein DUF4834 [Winogradskyella wandonensis]
MIFTLSVVGLARTILWIIAIYFIIKILSRLLAPFLIRFAARKMEEKFGQQFNQQYKQDNPKRKEGETVIDKMPNDNSQSNKKVGEYIDYEEID